MLERARLVENLAAGADDQYAVGAQVQRRAHRCDLAQRAVAEVLGEQHPTPMKRVGIRDTFGESAANEDLLAKYGLTPGHVAAAARSLMARAVPS